MQANAAQRERNNVSLLAGAEEPAFFYVGGLRKMRGSYLGHSETERLTIAKRFG